MKWILSLWLLAGCISCQKPATEKVVISILIDTTDKHLLPEIEEIISYLSSIDSEKEVLVRISHISGVDLNPVYELRRDGLKTGLLDNQVEEKFKERRFISELTRILTPPDSLKPQQHSSIFDPIITEATYLSGLMGYDHKQLLIWSDLKENNLDFISFYNPKTLEVLNHNPETLKPLFIERIRVPLDSKLHLQVIYQPKDHLENAQYKDLQGLYRAIFESIGLSITFSGNLTNATYPL